MISTESGLNSTQQTAKMWKFLLLTVAVVAMSSSSLGDGFSCEGKKDGIYADPKVCSKYYSCSNGIPYSMSCADGLYYNEDPGWGDALGLMDLDDFSGQFCGQGQYPLMNHIKNFLDTN
ncbi:Hypp1672 [Branchiostoma lanceolatum]|uniref:chitinase n=1 Tax=Branchiostoma lanceolatum TaxID=7740 RepID=A0A8K0EP90_BRALA|nr:Hypp1672 [Branchiostoma lanceolatum]